MDEIIQKEDFDPRKELFAERPDMSGGLLDKSKKPYWTPV
jgi:hypothetical protein